VGNALHLLSLEEAGGFLWEHQLQAWALDAGRGVVLFFNGVYLLAFWPTMAPVAVLVYIKCWEQYRYYRTVLLLSLALALPVFVAFPVAPPRLLPSFVNSLQAFGPSAYGGPGMTPFYNPLAAMPSFHFAWALLFGLLFFRSGPAWLKAVGLLYPALHFLAIVITGNHYILDAAGGFTVALASVLLYELFLRRQALALWLRRLLLASRAVRREYLRKRGLGPPIKAP
jgi:membrane-associated phospholipid phosphatase